MGGLLTVGTRSPQLLFWFMGSGHWCCLLCLPRSLTADHWESHMALEPSYHQLLTKLPLCPFHPIWIHLLLAQRQIWPRTPQDLTSCLNPTLISPWLQGKMSSVPIL